MEDQIGKCVLSNNSKSQEGEKGKTNILLAKFGNHEASI